MMQAATFLGWNGCGHAVWAIDEGQDYPSLVWEERQGVTLPTKTLREYLRGAGTTTNPFLIYTAEELDLVGAFSCEWGKSFQLMANVDLSRYGSTEFHPIGGAGSLAFTGVFDGRRHAITHLTYQGSGESFVGLFRYVGGTGQIRNLQLIGIQVEGGCATGGLAGQNNGRITSCSCSGYVSGTDGVGGLIGRNGVAGGLTTSVMACFGQCAVVGMNDVGGLIGVSSGSVSQCYAAGAVDGVERVGGLLGAQTGGTVSACYSQGPVFGVDQIGGMIGLKTGGQVNRSCWDVDVSGQAVSAGGTGITTPEMKTRSTFTTIAWDMVGEKANGRADYWRMCGDGVDYPRLAWEFGQGGDFDCPNSVGLSDLLYLAGRWMAATPEGMGAADANGDGRVDIVDFAMVGENWGK